MFHKRDEQRYSFRILGISTEVGDVDVDAYMKLEAKPPFFYVERYESERKSSEVMSSCKLDQW